MVLGFALHAALREAGLSLSLSAYLAVAAAAVAIAVYERLSPYRAAWLPDVREVGADAVFLALIQIALPYLIGLLLVVQLADLMADGRQGAAAFWPHDWAPAAQAALMMLIADFFRYWLHRLSHRVTALWQLHAVHHSPHRLYWLNVGRFHPIEKALQYGVDALPFVLLGVAPEVLVLYFVFYAINGFFQHSNCRVALGPLNYLISGPELHRWHHSEFPTESDRNFGNNLIVWDLLFGTWFLPRDREVGRLGLINRHYPRGFLRQMVSPFVPGLDKR